MQKVKDQAAKMFKRWGWDSADQREYFKGGLSIHNEDGNKFSKWILKRDLTQEVLYKAGELNHLLGYAERELVEDLK